MLYTNGPWFPVEYAGYWHLQKKNEYSATDSLLDEEKCPYAENNAKVAAAAPLLLKALVEAKELIRRWHGVGSTHGEDVEKKMWEIYDSQSSEMKRINDVLKSLIQ